MAILELDGRGSRRSMALGASRVDLDCFDRVGRSYPDGATASDLVFQHLALVTDDLSLTMPTRHGGARKTPGRRRLVVANP